MGLSVPSAAHYGGQNGDLLRDPEMVSRSIQGTNRFSILSTIVKISGG